MTDEIFTLQEELSVIRSRLPEADPEAIPVLRQWIDEIEREIQRYFAISEEYNKKYGANQNKQEQTETDAQA